VTPFLRKLLGMNWLLFASMVAIALAGVLFIHGASYLQPEEEYWQKQAKFVGIGIVVFLIVTMIDFRWVKWAAIPMYLTTIGLVALTHTGFGHTVKNATCWLKFGTFIFQPSQAAIIAGILTVALFLTWSRGWHSVIRVAGTAIIVAPTMVLVLKQPDLGMTAAWAPVVLAMLWIGGLPKRWIALILLTGLTALPLVINFGLKSYQRDRMVTFMDPDYDPRDTGYMINQSLTAIGSAGFGGKGFKEPGTQLEQGMIAKDVAHTDYIFTTIAEQWGFLGGVTVITAFGVLLAACLVTALRTRDPLGVLIVTGISTLVFFFVFQNIGMTIGLMPITGLPLPLISYSGTFALTLMFALGLVNSVWVHRHAAEEAE
jgi:rod shape determining protein RodA